MLVRWSLSSTDCCPVRTTSPVRLRNDLTRAIALERNAAPAARSATGEDSKGMKAMKHKSYSRLVVMFWVFTLLSLLTGDLILAADSGGGGGASCTASPACGSGGGVSCSVTGNLVDCYVSGACGYCKRILPVPQTESRACCSQQQDPAGGGH